MFIPQNAHWCHCVIIRLLADYVAACIIISAIAIAVVRLVEWFIDRYLSFD